MSDLRATEPQARPGLTQLPLAVRAGTEAPEVLPVSPPWKELARPGWGLLSAVGGGSRSGAPSGLSFRGTGQGEAEGPHTPCSQEPAGGPGNRLPRKVPALR